MQTKSNEAEEDEVGFVDGLFEMYKFGAEEARAEIITESVMLSYNDKFATFFFGTHMAYISSLIETFK